MAAIVSLCIIQNQFKMVIIIQKQTPLNYNSRSPFTHKIFTKITITTTTSTKMNKI